MKDTSDEEVKVGSAKENMSLGLDSVAKLAPRESSSNNDDVDNNSIKANIAALCAKLFRGTQKSCGNPDKDPTPTAKLGKKKSRQASWVHIAKAGTTPAPKETRQGAAFTADTQFNERQSKLARKTLGKNDSDLFTSVIHIKIKLFHGVPEVQAAIMALLDYCLATLQERDKHARLLNRDKTEEAFKAKDLPQDFTNFYNDWGLCNKRTQAFLNTIPEGKSRSFSASFCSNARCSLKPCSRRRS
jgi:hypothetical protein